MNEAASLTDMRNTANAEQVIHRAGVSSLDSGVPDVSLFAINHGRWPRVRVYCKFEPSGGTSPTVNLRVWVRKHLVKNEQGVEQLGILMIGDGTSGLKEFTVAADDRTAFDVPANGDDIFIEVTGVGGTPTMFVFGCALGWRA